MKQESGNGADIQEKSHSRKNEGPSMLYKLLYLAGAQVIRRIKRGKRAAARGTAAAKQNVQDKLGVCTDAVKSGLIRYAGKLSPMGAVKRCKAFFQAPARVWAGACLKRGAKAFITLFHYACPAAALMLLAYTVQYFTSLPYALSVEYGGRNIGYIADEAVFDTAKKNMKGRIIYEEYQQPEDTVPQFRLVVADDSMLASADALADEIIQASGNDIVEADGLYIDGEFIGATTDGESLLLMLDALKEPYREEYPDANIEFTKKIRIAEGLYPVSSVVELNTIETTINAEVEGEQVYTVMAGDAPITIAKKNDVTLESLRRLNPDIDKTLLPGQEVLISKSVPLLSVRATRKRTYMEEIPFQITEEVDESQYMGWSQVVSEGANGLREVEAEEIYEDGVLVSTNVLRAEVLDEPVNQVVKVGASTPSLSAYSWQGSQSNAFSVQSPNANGFIWPVGGSGGRVTCPIYGYYNHTGMDIGRIDTGTPIYAVADGVVTVAKQAPGYGKYIVIDHGNGLTTWYLHNSVLYVTPGQSVKQGQVISGAGQTGNAYGVHLHIEFRMNGRVLNPANYIGTR